MKGCTLRDSKMSALGVNGELEEVVYVLPCGSERDTYRVDCVPNGFNARGRVTNIGLLKLRART